MLRSSIVLRPAVLVLLGSISLGIGSDIAIDDGNGNYWDCERNVTEQPFDVARMAGLWYEVGRIPAQEMGACVKVVAPSSIDDNNDTYDLHVDFYNNVNNGWLHENLTVTFPSNVTQTGTFVLNYDYNIVVTFKLIATDYENMALLCSYTSLVPVWTIKLMTRNRTVSDELKQQLELLQQMANVTELTWVDQSERCDGAAALLSNLWLLSLGALIACWQRCTARLC